ncbi:MAG: hypothetical protein AB7T63_15655 [Planctomycetota bacterium]
MSYCLGVATLVVLLGGWSPAGLRRALPKGAPEAPLFVQRRLPVGGARSVFDGPAIESAEDIKRVDQAIERGCAYLVAQQAGDGSWQGQADPAYRWGVTALAVLALMDAGHPYLEDTPESRALRGGIEFLCASQDGDGCVGPRAAQKYVYNHAFAAYAILRACDLHDAAWLLGSANKALAFSAMARNPYHGWRYGLKPADNDPDISGAMMLAHAVGEGVGARAVKRGRSASLSLDDGAVDGVSNVLQKLTDFQNGRVGYLERGGGPGRYVDLHGASGEKFPFDLSQGPTAISAWFYLRFGKDEEAAVQVERAIKLMAGVAPAWTPDRGNIDQYYWLWGARVAHEQDRKGGPPVPALEAWRGAAVHALLDGQEGGTAASAGSWPPVGAWGAVGGRVYSTAVAVSTLKLSAYRGAPVAEPDARELVKHLRDRKADLDDRLALLEGISPEAPDLVVKTVAGLLSDAEPLVRLAAAEALARIGPAADAHRTLVGRQLAREQLVPIRQALVFALLRMSRASKSVMIALQRAAEDPDAGVRLLGRLAEEALAAEKPIRGVRGLHWVPTAAAAVELLKDAGQLEPESAARRAAAARWALLRSCRLPYAIGGRVGQRLAVLPAGPLEQASVLEAAEKALAAAASPEVPPAEQRALTDAALEAIERLSGASAGRARLAAALEVHAARAAKGGDGSAVADGVRRLELHVAELKEVASKAGEQDRAACSLVELACQDALAVLLLQAKAPGAEERVRWTIALHEEVARTLYLFPELRPWSDLGRAELLEKLAEAAPTPDAFKAARDVAAEVMGAVDATTNDRRASLRAAAMAARLAPLVPAPPPDFYLSRQSPPAPLERVTTKEELRVELLDVAFLRLPLETPKGRNEWSDDEQLVIRTRIKPPTEGLTWDDRAWRLIVRARRGKAAEQGPPLPPWVDDARSRSVEESRLGANWRPEDLYAKGYPVSRVHVVRATEADLADGIVVDIGIQRSDAGASEPLFSAEVPRAIISGEVKWSRLARDAGWSVSRLQPRVDETPEAVDALLLVSSYLQKAQLFSDARGLAERAEEGAKALGDPARLEEATKLREALEPK